MMTDSHAAPRRYLSSRPSPFGLLAAVGIGGAGPIVGLSGARGGLATALYGATTALALLAATAVCIRLTGSSWRDAGLDLAPRRLKDLAFGFHGPIRVGVAHETPERA